MFHYQGGDCTGRIERDIFWGGLLAFEEVDGYWGVRDGFEVEGDAESG